MATYVTDDGICLRVTDFSETSQIVGMFTRQHGLVPLIAKGAKRASKKNVMSGPLDLLTSGEVVFVPARDTGGGGGRGGGGVQLGTLAAWNLADHRRELRGNLAALNAAMVCAEITTHLLQPLDPHESLFDELAAAIELLGQVAAGATDAAASGRNGAGESARRARALLAYVKAALVETGYWPRMDACLVCGRAVTDTTMRFSPRAGGVICGQGQEGCHVDNAGMTLTVPGRIVLALDRLPSPAQLLANPPERVADEKALATALQLLLAHVEALTDKGLRTRFLLRGMFNGKSAGGGA